MQNRMHAAHRLCAFIFFFQAEDGIRDYKVTGVQTCALPISSAYVNSFSVIAVEDIRIAQQRLPERQHTVDRRPVRKLARCVYRAIGLARSPGADRKSVV